MTTYNYMIEMQELCFRISQAAKVLGKKGTQDVYEACEKGFYEMAKELTCEEAGSPINPDQLDIYVCAKNFCTEQEKQAANKISDDNTEHTYTEAEVQAFNKIMNDLQEDAEVSKSCSN